MEEYTIEEEKEENLHANGGPRYPCLYMLYMVTPPPIAMRSAINAKVRHMHSAWTNISLTFKAPKLSIYFTSDLFNKADNELL